MLLPLLLPGTWILTVWEETPEDWIKECRNRHSIKKAHDTHIVITWKHQWYKADLNLACGPWFTHCFFWGLHVMWCLISTAWYVLRVKDIRLFCLSLLCLLYITSNNGHRWIWMWIWMNLLWCIQCELHSHLATPPSTPTDEIVPDRMIIGLPVNRILLRDVAL